MGVRKRESVCGCEKESEREFAPSTWCLWARCNQRHYTSYNYISSAVVPLLYRCILVTVKELCVRY